MVCRYCQLIHSFDYSYPLRKATRGLNSDYPRCDWHWRFMCSLCGKPRHFNGVAWCEKTQKFICIRCGKDHRVVYSRFWGWRYYYAIGCRDCEERHPALDRLEFLGKHPWQINPKMRRGHVGLSAEMESPKISSTFIPIKKATVTEEEIS